MFTTTLPGTTAQPLTFLGAPISVAEMHDVWDETLELDPYTGDGKYRETLPPKVSGAASKSGRSLIAERGGKAATDVIKAYATHLSNAQELTDVPRRNGFSEGLRQVMFGEHWWSVGRYIVPSKYRHTGLSVDEKMGLQQLAQAGEGVQGAIKLLTFGVAFRDNVAAYQTARASTDDSERRTNVMAKNMGAMFYNGGLWIDKVANIAAWPMMAAGMWDAAFFSIAAGRLFCLAAFSGAMYATGASIRDVDHDYRVRQVREQVRVVLDQTNMARENALSATLKGLKQNDYHYNEAINGARRVLIDYLQQERVAYLKSHSARHNGIPPHVAVALNAVAALTGLEKDYVAGTLPEDHLRAGLRSILAHTHSRLEAELDDQEHVVLQELEVARGLVRDSYTPHRNTDLSTRYETEIARLEDEIYAEAGLVISDVYSDTIAASTAKRPLSRTVFEHIWYFLPFVEHDIGRTRTEQLWDMLSDFVPIILPKVTIAKTKKAQARQAEVQAFEDRVNERLQHLRDFAAIRIRRIREIETSRDVLAPEEVYNPPVPNYMEVGHIAGALELSQESGQENVAEVGAAYSRAFESTPRFLQSASFLAVASWSYFFLHATGLEAAAIVKGAADLPLAVVGLIAAFTSMGSYLALKRARENKERALAQKKKSSIFYYSVSVWAERIKFIGSFPLAHPVTLSLGMTLYAIGIGVETVGHVYPFLKKKKGKMG